MSEPIEKPPVILEIEKEIALIKERLALLEEIIKAYFGHG